MATDRFAGMGELFPELESEREWEAIGESEADRFFGRLASEPAASPSLQRLAEAAAESILGAGEFESESEFEDEVSPLARLHPELGGSGGLNPQARAFGPRSTLALMEHLGHAAAEAESAAESENYVRALVPLATTLFPRVAPALARSAPGLARGISQAVRILRRHPQTRPLVRTLPAIIRSTASRLARQADAAARGRTPAVTPNGAVRVLADQTRRALANPGVCVQLWQRSRDLDRHFHGQGAISPSRSCQNCGQTVARPCSCGCGRLRRFPCPCSGGSRGGSGCSCTRCRGGRRPPFRP